MMSLFSSPATMQSSPSVDPLRARTHLTAVDIRPTSQAGRASRNSSIRKKMISKAYNIVAARPLARPSFSENVITVNMRYNTITVVSSSTTTPALGAVSFSLSNFDNYTEFTGLFDQYKIDELEVWLEPQISQATVLTNTGLLCTAIDLDDANAPTTFGALEDKQTALTTNGQDGHYHRWVPHIAIAAYSGAFTSFSNAPSQWIDSASASVQHYGLKFGLTATSVVVNYNLQVRAKVSFKQPGI